MCDMRGGFGDVQHWHGQHLLQRVLAVLAEPRQNHRVVIEFTCGEHGGHQVHHPDRG